MLRKPVILAAVTIGWMVGVPALHAETAELELKILSESPEYRSGDNYYSMTSPQHFMRQPGMPELPGDKEFAALVKKEPPYLCDTPLKGVARLGSYRYPFVLDSTNLAAEGYNRLYLDRDRDGDLANEKAIRPKRSDIRFGGSYRHRDFPRQTLEVEADGTTFEMPVSLSVFSNMHEGDLHYAGARLQSAAYRHGKITVDGKSHEIVLLDYNSNGTFNDLFVVDDAVTGGDGELYPGTGDMVLVDPDHKAERYIGYSPSDSPDRQYLSKLVSIDGRFYSIQVSAAGDRVTVTPAQTPLGEVVSAGGPFRAVLFGEQGLIKIGGQADQPIRLPVGDWRMLEYALDLTHAGARPASQPSSAPAEPAPKKRSLGQRLAGILGLDDGPAADVAFGPKLTLVTARATRQAKTVAVSEGKTQKLAFGPPYKPVVSVGYVHEKEAHLQLKLVGTDGEVCETMMVKGSQPGKPAFRITRNDGTLVQKGQFEYG